MQEKTQMNKAALMVDIQGSETASYIPCARVWLAFGQMS